MSVTRENFAAADAPGGAVVYLVDDDGDFVEEMVFGLSKLGLEVHGFHDAASLYKAFAVRSPDMVVLDIGLEGEDGLSIAAYLRTLPSVGIILATARGAVDDRIEGLRRGADAYLVKPIDVRELAATIATVSQRLGKKRSAARSPALSWTLEDGGWVLSDGTGHRLTLTASEQLILGRLFQARGKTVGRRELVEALGEDVYDFNYAHLDTIMSRLRRRAEKANLQLPLHAIRGVGFTFGG